MSFTGAPYITVDPTTGALLATYPDGTVVPVEAAPAPSTSYEGAPNAVPSAAGGGGTTTVQDPLYFVDPAAGTASDSGSSSSGYGYTKRGYSRGSYGSSGYRGGYDDDYVPHPTYASGALHPAWGGEPLVPGGRFARDSQYEDDYRAPLSVPSGPHVPSYGGIGSSSGGGGGGGDVRGLISAWRSKLIGGMYPGGGSDSYGSSSYGGGTSQPHEERMHGEYAHGLDPSQAAGLTMRPTAMIPRVFHGLSPAEPLYTNLANIPAGQMALLTGKGTPQSIANKVGKIYEGAGTTGALPSTGKLMHGLTSGRGIEDMVQGVKAGPHDYESYYAPGYVSGQEPMGMAEAASTVGGLLDAALYSEPLLTQQKYSGTIPGGWGSYLLDRWGSKALKKPAGRGVPSYRYAGKRLFRSG